MQQTSRLAIVVDTSNAKQQLADFTKQLNEATKAASKMSESVEQSLSSKGSKGAVSQINATAKATSQLGTEAQQAALMQDKLATSAAKTATAQSNSAKAAANATTAQNRQAASSNSLAVGNNNLIQSEFAVERAMNKTIASETQLQMVQNSLAGSVLRLGTAQQNAATNLVLNQNRVAASHSNVARTATMADIASLKFVRAQNDVSTSATRTQTELARLSTQQQRLAAAASAAGGAAAREGVNLNGLAGSVIRLQREEARLQGDLLRNNALMDRQAAAAARAAAGLDGMGSAANRANAASRGLHGTMNKLYTVMNSGLIAVTGLGFIKTAAEMQNLNNQIRLVTKSEEEAIGTKKELMKIANENYSDIGSTINLYQKSARALGNLGKSQADTLKFTNAISLAMRTGGRSAGENAAAILQLGQAMGAGVIMGDEFRSISENAPILLSLVAKEMGVLQGDLKKMSQDGLITAEIMYNAVVENEAMLTDIANGMAITMGQSWMVAKNKFKEFTDDLMNETGGVSDHISQAVLIIGNNFGSMAKIIGGVAVVALGSYIATTLTALAVNNGLTLSALGTSGAFSLYAGTVAVTTGVINGFIAVSTIASTVAGRVMSLGAMTASGAFGALTGTISAAAAAAGRWSTYSGVASAATGILTGAVSVATGAFTRLATVINAHPLMALAGVLIAIVASTKDANGEMLGLSGAMSSLGDTIGVVGGILGNFIGMGVEGFSSLVNSAMNMIGNLVSGSKDGTDKSKQSFGSLFGVTETGFLGIAQGAASAFDMASLTILAFANKAINHLGNLFVRAKNTYSSAKAWFGFGNGAQEKLYETSFGNLIGQQAGRLSIGSGGGFRGMIDDGIGEQKAEKARKAAAFVPTTMEMVAGSGLQQQLKAQRDAAEAAAKEAKKNAGKNKKPDSNQMMVYKAWMNAGLSDNQSRIITAEVGRENDYQSKFLYGGHNDPKNGKYNLGMISWQKDRGEELFKYLKGLGLIQNNQIVKGQESLNAQAMFAVKEMTTNPRFERTKKDFLADGDVGYDKGKEILGNNYIAWDYKNKKYDSGHSRRDKHYEKLNSELGNSSVSSSLSKEYDEAEKLNKERLDFAQQFESVPQKILRETDEKMVKIKDLFTGDELTKYEGMIKASSERELTIHNKTISDKVSASEAYRMTEVEKINKTRDDLVFQAITDADLIRPENKEAQARVLKAIDDEHTYALNKNQLLVDQKVSELWSFQKTDRELFEQGWDFKFRESKLINDELNQEREDANKKYYAKDNELFNLNERQKRFDLNKYKMSDTESMVASIALERERITLSNATPEQKREQSYAAGYPIKNSITEMMNGFDNSGTAEGNDYLALDAKHAENLEKIKAYEAEVGAVEGFAYTLRLAAEKAYQEAKAELVVNNGEGIAGSLASIAKDTMGEQSSIFRAMFAMEKGFAIARSIMNIQVALSSAAASLPFPANLGAIATVAAEGASIVSTITSIAGQGFEKGGYTGSMGTKDIAGVVHGQEYVFDAKATKRIGVNNLEAMSNGQSIGGGDVNINVTVDGNGNSQVSGDNDKMGREMANGIKAVVMDIMRKEKRQGGMLYA